MALTPRKRLVQQLDALFGTYIKIRDKRAFNGCFYCGKPIEHVFHFITRSKFAVRWDERNAAGSCAGCNIRYEYDTVFIAMVHEAYKRMFGEARWDDLLNIASRPAKFSLDDLRAIKQRLQDSMTSVCIARATFGSKA